MIFLTRTESCISFLSAEMKFSNMVYTSESICLL